MDTSQTRAVTVNVPHVASVDPQVITQGIQIGTKLLTDVLSKQWASAARDGLSLVLLIAQQYAPPSPPPAP